MRIDIPFPMLALFCLFFVLKMAGVITWSWWFVTAPLWFIPAFLIGFLLAVLGVIFIGLVFCWIIATILRILAVIFGTD